MAYKIPNHVIKQYGSARAFKARKRKLVKEMQVLLNELKLGCAYLPEGDALIDRLHYELEVLARSLSVKNWGR